MPHSLPAIAAAQDTFAEPTPSVQTFAQDCRFLQDTRNPNLACPPSLGRKPTTVEPTSLQAHSFPKSE